MIHLIKDSSKDKDVSIKPIKFTLKKALKANLNPQEEHRIQVKPLLNNGLTIEELTLRQQTYTETVNADGKTIEWVLPHSRKFPEFINTHFATYSTNSSMFIKNIAESTDESPPFPYQQLIKEYLRYGTPYRSLLLEHGLGSGKSRSAIMVAETFREQGLPVLIMTPAFLRLNFMDEIHKWGGDDIKIDVKTSSDDVKARQRIIDESYHFIHYNATGYSIGAKDKFAKDIGGKSGVMEQLAKLGIGFPPDSVYGKKFPYLNEKYGPLKPPSNMLIIIEEIHNMNRTFNKGASKSQVKFFLYPLLLMAKDCKIIGLSGTPIISSPFEMATLYNILRGEITIPGSSLPFYTLPQDEETFKSTFVNYDGLTLINHQILMSRIMGLTSLFKGVTDDVDRIIFPAGKDKALKVELEMSEYQTEVHDYLLEEEEKKSLKSKPKTAAVALPGELTNAEFQLERQMELPAAYHINSRQASNFVFPIECPRPRPRETPSFEKIPLLKNYIFTFKTDLQSVFEKLAIYSIDLSSISQFNETEDMSIKRRLLTSVIKEAYPNLIPVDSSVWLLLSEEDKIVLLPYTGSYQERLQNSISKLFANPQKYFSLKNLQKYSIKMAEIYKNITGDIDHGACCTVKLDSAEDLKLKLNEETETEYEADIADFSEIEPEQDSDDSAELTTLSIKTIDDKDDPMRLHMDVYKTDEELKARKLRVKGGPALVYSFFNSVEGAGIFSKVLEAHGFEQFNEKTWDGHSPIESLTRSPRYAFIKGGMNVKLKAKIMRVFNNRANRHGQIIRVIFATQAAAEGISLYHLRQIHIMEPHWDNVLIEQVIGRGFRLRSHRYLSDPSEREIQIYQYYARRNSYVSKSTEDSKNTIDYKIQAIADRKSTLVSQLKLLRGQVAIDCKINSEYNNLGIKCFDFRGNVQGDAFTSSIFDDVKQSQATKQKVIETKLKYNVVKMKLSDGVEKTFVIFDDEKVKIKIKNPKTQEFKVYLVDKAWHSESWNAKQTGYEPLNRADFSPRGYIYPVFSPAKDYTAKFIAYNRDLIEEVK